MVKNKALRLCQTLQTPPSGHSLSPSPSQTWPYHGWSHVSSLSLSLTPFILRVSPGSCRGWTPANDGHPTERVQGVLEPAGHKEAAHTSIQAPPPAPCGASSPRQHLSWRHTSPSGPNAGWAQHRCRGLAISAQHKASLLGSLCSRTVVLAEMLTSLHSPSLTCTTQYTSVLLPGLCTCLQEGLGWLMKYFPTNYVLVQM